MSRQKRDNSLVQGHVVLTQSQNKKEKIVQDHGNNELNGGFSSIQNLRSLYVGLKIDAIF